LEGDLLYNKELTKEMNMGLLLKRLNATVVATNGAIVSAELMPSRKRITESRLTLLVSSTRSTGRQAPLITADAKEIFDYSLPKVPAKACALSESYERTRLLIQRKK
jgi:hypothetical protein